MNENETVEQQPDQPLDYKQIKLDAKEKKFIGFYLGKANMNGAKAYAMCDFSKAKPENFRIMACQMLKRPNVALYIELFQADHLMQAGEVLARLSDFARGSIEDLVDDKGHFNYQKALDNEAVYLIKKLKRKTTVKATKRETQTSSGVLNEDDSIEESIETSIILEEVEFETHDPLTALVQIGKHHKLFTDNHHLSGELEYVTFEIETGAKQSSQEE